MPVVLRARLQRNVHQLPGRMAEGHDVIVGVWSVFFAHANGDGAAVISRDSERRAIRGGGGFAPFEFYRKFHDVLPTLHHVPDAQFRHTRAVHPPL